jgi:hypothetical protein
VDHRHDEGDVQRAESVGGASADVKKPLGRVLMDDGYGNKGPKSFLAEERRNPGMAQIKVTL